MKRTYVSTAVLTLVLGTLSMAQTAPAAGAAATPASTTTAATTPGGVKVGIIDIQQAIIATNEGARDFDTLKKQLNTQGDKMNAEARDALVKQIEAKQKTLQRTGEDAKNDYEQQQNEIAQRILQKMAPVIDKYAKSNGYGLLFDSSNPWPQGPLLWATAGVDLTKAIVDAYNAQSGIAAPPRPAGAPGATQGKPVGTATPPAGTKPATAATTTH